MSKPLLNNRINYNNFYGRIIQHDLFLNQGVRSGDSPTFQNLQLTGDAVIEGNLLVEGQTSIFNSNIIEMEDNIILINRLETGPGISLGQAGLEIERGSLENVRIIYDESDDLFKTGPISDLRPIANVELNPLDKGVFVWNATNNRQEAQDFVELDFTFTSTQNATNNSSASLVVNGGLSVNKNILLNDQLKFNTTGSISSSNGNLLVSSGNQIELSPNSFIKIPYNKSIIFNDTTNSITTNTSGILEIKSTQINVTSARINIPQTSRLNFSTTSESIYTESSNNLNITSSQDVNIIPGLNKRVLIPIDTPIAFSNSLQRILANALNDLSIFAGNNILLTPGAGLNVQIPANANLKFGSGGDQRIYADNLNKLFITSSSDITMTNPTVNNLIVHGILTNRLDSAVDLINVDANMTLRSTGSLTLQNGYLYTNNTTIGNGYGTSSSMIINSLSSDNALRLISFETQFDTISNYLIGRKSRTLNINIPNYTSYNSIGTRPKFIISSSNGNLDLLTIDDIGTTIFTNTLSATSVSNASVIIYGGLGISKDIISNGFINNNVNSTQALLVSSEDMTHKFRVDTVNSQVVLNSLFIQQTNGNIVLQSDPNSLDMYNTLNVYNSTESTSFTNASVSIRGGVSIWKKLQVWGETTMHSPLDMSLNKIINVQDPTDAQDVVTKGYVDMILNGLDVKDACHVATTTPIDLMLDTVVGNTIDNYVLQVENRLLVKDQLDKIENGIYVIQSSGSAIRSDDLRITASAMGAFTFVINGTMNMNLGWLCNTSQPNDIVGTDPLNFTQFTGLGQVVAGDALSKIFNEINVNVDDYSIEIFSDALRIKSDTLSTGLTGGSGTPITTDTDQSHVTKLGIINTGTWQADTIGVMYGGTGRSFFTQGNILFGNNVDSISTDQKLFYNPGTNSLGIGTNIPTANLEIINTSDASILLSSVIGQPIIQLGTLSNLKNSLIDPSLLIESQNKIQLLINTNPKISISDSQVSVLTNLYVDNSVLFDKNANSTNASNGGTLTVLGGASVSKDLYVGGILYSESTNANALNIASGGAMISELNVNSTNENYIGNFIFKSDSVSNYIQSSINRTEGSFNPIKFSNVGTDVSVSITQDGLIVENNNYLQIGGASDVNDGYRINYTNGSLRILPVSTSNNIIIESGNLELNGTNGSITWNSNQDDITFLNTDIKLTDAIDTLTITAPTNGVVYINSDNLLTLNIGENGVSETSVKLSNVDGTHMIEFLPNSTQSSFNIKPGVISTISDKAIFEQDVYFSGKSLLTNINNTNGSAEWIYLTNLSGKTNLEWNGYSKTILECSINDTTLNISHAHIGELAFNNALRGRFYVYETAANYYLYLRVPSLSNGNIFVYNSDSDFVTENEGISAVPNGNVSGFNNWNLSYTTEIESTLKYTVGDLTVEDQVLIKDNLPIIGYNKMSTMDTGILGERYQISNDVGTGDVVSDMATYTDILPSQTLVNTTQIRFSNLANSTDEFYTGYWIKITSGLAENQVRQITSYNGSLRLATISVAWTTQNPQIGDSVDFYNNLYSTLYYNENDKIFKLGYTHTSGALVTLDNYAGLRLLNLVTESFISVAGGITITDSRDATSYTQGNAFTSYGGGSFNKKVIVGDNIVISKENIVSPTASLEISQSVASINLIGVSASNLTFSKTSSLINYTIGLENDQLAINDSIIISSNGNVGINTTTNLASPFGISAGHFISVDLNNSFLGLTGNNSDNDSTAARIKLYGNTATGSNGNLDLYTGSIGNTNIYHDTKLTIQSNNITTRFYNTENSFSSTYGSVIIDGGLSLSSTQNAQSYTAGGAITVAGGVSLNKDLYVGGNIYVSGAVVAPGSVTSPVITFSNETNCTVSSYSNSTLVNVADEAIYSVYIQVLPTVSSQNTQFLFSVPDRTVNFASRGDIIISASGWVDDINVIPLMNLIGVGETGSTNALIKFQSASTTMHYIQLTCRYNII